MAQKEFSKNERGATLVEYTLLLAVLVITVVTATQAMGNGVESAFASLNVGRQGRIHLLQMNAMLGGGSEGSGLESGNNPTIGQQGYDPD